MRKGTIHGPSESVDCTVVLAQKGQATGSDEACEAGTAPTAADKSIEGAADARSADGLWLDGWRRRE